MIYNGKKAKEDDDETHGGHRKRLRERFCRDGLDSFSEHEALELLLTFAIPQRDVNPLAHRLVNHFGSIAGVLSASRSELMSIEGVGEYAAVFLTMMPQLFSRYQKSAMGERPVINTIADAKRLCGALFTDAQDEQFYGIFLDKQGRLIQAEMLYEGTTDEVTIYPRQIAERAIYRHAYGVMFAHNHPSGKLEPSRADVETTRTLIRALDLISVSVIDHMIVTKTGLYSMVRKEEFCMDAEEENKEAYSYIIRKKTPARKSGKPIGDLVEWRRMSEDWMDDEVPED